MIAPTTVEAIFGSQVYRIRTVSAIVPADLPAPERLSWCVQHLRSWYANRWIRYGLALLLLALVVLKVNPGHLGAALSSARAAYLLLALALSVPFLYAKSLRWYIMLQAAGIDATFGEAGLSLLGGMGLALLTPARLGELVRVAYLRDSQKWKLGGLVMLDKGFDVLVLVVLSIAGAWSLLGVGVGVAFAAVGVTGLIFVYQPRWLARLLPGLRRRTEPADTSSLRARLQAVWSSLESLSLRSTTSFLLLTLLAFGIVLLQFGVILGSWHAWSPEIVFFTFPLVILTNVLPVTIGGLGIREGAAALLLSHYGVAPADAALAAFLMFAINTALPGIAGAVLLPATHRATRQAVQSLDHP